MDLIANARALALRAHDGQTRKGAAQEPYWRHLEEVAALVTRFGGGEALVAAAWLHDTVEDCGLRIEDLAAEFGVAVAALVAEVTDDKALHPAARKRMQIANAPKKSDGGALLKICDKIANVGSVADSPAMDWDTGRQTAYLDWAADVVSALPAGADPARELFFRTLARARDQVAGRMAPQG